MCRTFFKLCPFVSFRCANDVFPCPQFWLALITWVFTFDIRDIVALYVRRDPYVVFLVERKVCGFSADPLRVIKLFSRVLAVAGTTLKK